MAELVKYAIKLLNRQFLSSCAKCKLAPPELFWTLFAHAKKVIILKVYLRSVRGFTEGRRGRGSNLYGQRFYLNYDKYREKGRATYGTKPIIEYLSKRWAHLLLLISHFRTRKAAVSS